MDFFALTLTSLALCAITAASTPSYDAKPQTPTVTIDSGVVAGTVTRLPSSETTVNKFLGIPFGAPPVRFTPPKPVAPWDSVYDASDYKPACIQQFSYPEEARKRAIEWYNTPGPPAGESEDCLNLNVFAPASGSGSPKAVLFWVYGGGYTSGTGSLPLYDGSSFAANQDIVVVTFNYRTNVFGFPGSSELPPKEWNLGLLDQRLALDWVQRNIAAFGGDPKMVTIVGESAGAGSVDGLITSPPDPLPFRAAIFQSNDGSVPIIPSDPATSWKKLLETTKCASDKALDCIRAISALELKEIVERQQLQFGPVPDGGATWADSPRKDRLNSTDQQSRIARVPVLVGSNADEARVIVYGQNDTAAFLGNYISEEAAKVLINAYPIGTPGISSEFERLAAIVTDFAFQCLVKLLAEESTTVGIDAWRYYFNASFPNTELFAESGVYHFSEIQHVFGTYPRKGATKFEVEVSKGMQDAWANFAKNPSNGPGWEKVPQLGVLGGGARVGADDTGRVVLEAIETESVDEKCVLYQQLYDIASGM
ncbi:hypothetical protein AJ79_08563 [Helicocarpus griseus UAMH5409]|uniref:Carboxylic ester hydrolase n=1 Tax=Helicocarpus griseus UAMH5409 TaxID=1447875 RepID=A0A2B7WRT0_9EURO|nr:hypothetical protein AJ79_08563 [Helicocarpus griseus UAMH5409]